MGSKRVEAAAIYCPLWHNYDHASSWKGEGWCEWELLKSARPRFDGHYQPFKPEWGCFDESDPAWAAREIDLAADHSIDVFIFQIVISPPDKICIAVPTLHTSRPEMSASTG